MIDRSPSATTGRPTLDPAPADGMAAVDPDAWDAIAAPGQGPLRHGYVAAWENAELRGLALRPLVAHEPGGDGILAASPAYFYDLDMAVVQSPFLAGIVGRVRKLFPRLLLTRVYEIGSSAPLVVPFARADGVGTPEAADAILRAGLAEAARGGAQMVIVQNFEAHDEGPAARALRRHGFEPVPIPATAVAQLPYASFDEYLGAMRAQYRRRARKIIEASSHLRVEHARDFAELAPELARLWKLVYDRAGEVKREVLPEAYFRAVSDLDEVSALLLRRDDGSIASFALLMDDHPWLHFLFCGFEEEAGREEGAYFRLIYEIVRNAIERGFPTVNFGMTTLPPKMDAGGTPVELCAWMRHRRPLLQRLFVALGRGPFAPHPPELRTVFKEST